MFTLILVAFDAHSDDITHLLFSCYMMILITSSGSTTLTSGMVWLFGMMAG